MCFMMKGAPGAIPFDHVPDAITRINLYARLARLTAVEEIDAFEEELQDRFGPMPEPLGVLLAQARLSALARAAAVRGLSAGPKGLAVDLVEGAKISAALTRRLPAETHLKGSRLVVPAPTETQAERLELAERVLTALAA